MCPPTRSVQHTLAPPCCSPPSSTLFRELGGLTQMVQRLKLEVRARPAAAAAEGAAAAAAVHGAAAAGLLPRPGHEAGARGRGTRPGTRQGHEAGARGRARWQCLAPHRLDRSPLCGTACPACSPRAPCCGGAPTMQAGGLGGRLWSDGGDADRAALHVGAGSGGRGAASEAAALAGSRSSSFWQAHRALQPPPAAQGPASWHRHGQLHHRCVGRRAGSSWEGTGATAGATACVAWPHCCAARAARLGCTVHQACRGCSSVWLSSTVAETRAATTHSTAQHNTTPQHSRA